MKKIKLLRIIATLDPASGGPVAGILHVTPFLSMLNIETTIVTLDDPDSMFLKKFNNELVPLGKRKSPWQYNNKLGSWLKVNLANFDVSIVHGIWLYHTYSAVKAFVHLNKTNQKVRHKMFLFPHGMLDPYFQTEKNRKSKALRNWMYWQIIEKRNINSVSGILFTSKMEMELAKKTFSGYNPKKEIMAGYGVNIPTIVSKIDLNPENYILFLGRIHIKKGIDWILNVYLNILENNLGKPLKLIIAGPGIDSEHGLYLQSIIQNNDSLKKLVDLRPLQNEEAKWALIKNARAQILWSHQENFGLSIAESLGVGVPVLLSNQVNISQLVIEENAGYVSPINLPKMTESLLTFLQLSEDKYLRMKENACQVYQKNFMPMNYAERLRAIFEEELGNIVD